MPLQIPEGEEWEEGERKDLVERYLPRNWFAHKEFELLWSFQPSLEMKARLTSCIFLKPRPPTSFGRHREDQDLRERFLA
jgi:hypothetical protein